MSALVEELRRRLNRYPNYRAITLPKTLVNEIIEALTSDEDDDEEG